MDTVDRWALALWILAASGYLELLVEQRMLTSCPELRALVEYERATRD